MSSEYEDGRSALVRLLEWYKKEVNTNNRNEATTRLHLIDRLLFECLGWKREECKSEERLEGEYTDYSLFCPYRALIVEAKREGIYFELPAGQRGLYYSLKSLCKDNKKISDAVKQVMDYCQSRGTPLGAVCNGHQLICCVASRDDGRPPLDGDAVVFSSLKTMLEKFLIFWKYLSKPGVEERHLQKVLMGPVKTALPPKLSAACYPYPGTKQRNALQIDLHTVGEVVIEDVNRVREIEADFIMDCFCSSGALSQYALVSRSILENRYAALSLSDSEETMVPASTKKGITEGMFTEGISRRPIILLGDVGVGKTMFIRNLIKVEVAELLEDAIVLYLDLGVGASLTPDVKSFFLSEIEMQLNSNYDIEINERNFVRGVYHGDLLQFEKGIHGDLKEIDPKAYRKNEIQFLEEKINKKHFHIKKCLEHIYKGRRKQIVIFIDNADQRNPDVQQQAFMIGQEIAATWPVTVFLSIRPETFYRSKKSGSLSAYHTKAFTISPPRVDEVLGKRMRFAIKVAAGDVELKLLSDISVKLQRLRDYLHIILYSFEQKDELVEFIDNICMGNIRLALEFVTTFIGSGHINTQEILDIDTGCKNGTHYIVPLHKFMKAIILGDNEFYDPGVSNVVNLFDINTPDGKEHFILPIVLGYLSRESLTAGKEGFVEQASIFEYGQQIGFTPDQIGSAIRRALQKNLVEGSPKFLLTSDNRIPDLYRMTTIGAYHVRKLIHYFVYVDAVIVDTPILDDDFRRKITNVMNISDRLKRTALFCEYLDSQWLQVKSRTLGFDWPDISSTIKNEIDKIRTKISANN